MSMNRRTIVRGAAWTIPVVSIAAAAPAFATSRFTCTPRFCKTQNKKDSDRWDFKVYPTCSSGTVASVLINGKPATRRFDLKGREFWVLERQPHSYTFMVRVTDSTGTVGFDALADVRYSSCPV